MMARTVLTPRNLAITSDVLAGGKIEASAIAYGLHPSRVHQIVHNCCDALWPELYLMGRPLESGQVSKPPLAYLREQADGFLGRLDS